GIARQVLQSHDSTEGFVLPFLFYGLGYGQFIYHNLFAYLMEMTFALLAGLVLGGAVNRKMIMIFAAIAIVVWAALVLSDSRGAFLSLTFQTVFLVFMSLKWYSARRSARNNPGRQRFFTALAGSKLVRLA